ncbi:DEAD/DEAH box helicase [Nocardia sp. 2]|uniref:DEAD/DEAH box helicase n=1 Tax=Nocardia acididurans TaxID=2802282 RepID=A0ABS1MAN8_9NOCA|nr:DEAD/DEAH box helicase [Nocardia acididurans]MBL1077314.1 DEAD/DEAH box helicase [Nocardia acididurans]
MKATDHTDRSEIACDPSYGQSLLNRVLTSFDAGDPRLTHVRELPPRAAQVTEWPEWISADVRAAVQGIGVDAPWAHQTRAADIAAGGGHVVLSTGTASGKSLAYQMPVLTALQQDPRATALYLSPTKALGADQLRMATELTDADPLRGIHPAPYDGDTPQEIRQWVRANSRWVFTNPDMLHLGMLRSHERWGRLLRQLRYVVVDECHTYRGVFGSHVALVLRRLRRMAQRYGADPVFVLCSATTSDPAHTASKLIGAPCTAVTEDGSPQGARTVALWEPPLVGGGLTGENGAAIRRSAGAEAAKVMAELVAEGARTLTFVRSRRGAELIAMDTRRLLAEVDTALPERIAAYRSGYLAEDRRALETALSEGSLLGAATTNALELGVDIAGLDAVVVAGYPGTVASFWQQAGRAGRRTQGSLVLLIARDDPLDTYLVHHPEALLGRPMEASITDPHNPYVLGPHLLCAAMEQPLTDAEVLDYGAWELLSGLARQGVIRRRPGAGRDGSARWFVTADSHPHDAVDVRGGIGAAVAIVESETGRMLGTTDAGRAPATLHPGAVHLHQGESYVVDELDLDEGIALVHAETPGWTTSARAVTALEIEEVTEERVHGTVTTALGRVFVTRQVIGYLRRLPSGEVLDMVSLDMPAQTLPTRAVFYTVTPELLRRAGIDAKHVAGALHAAEHAAIGMLPLVATCDRWDIGGVSIAEHPDTGLPTVFVYDGHPGGAGFAERGFARLRHWLTATLAAIRSCGCASGCPSCVQSPKCGNGNNPLDKAGAGRLLAEVLAELGDDDEGASEP